MVATYCKRSRIGRKSPIGRIVVSHGEVGGFWCTGVSYQTSQSLVGFSTTVLCFNFQIVAIDTEATTAFCLTFRLTKIQ